MLQLKVKHLFFSSAFTYSSSDTEELYSAVVVASWTGFDWENTGEINYRWAMVSEERSGHVIKQSGPNASDPYRCRATSGIWNPNPNFPHRPDMILFHPVRSTFVSQLDIRVRLGHIYFVIVEASHKGEILYGNSFPISIPSNSSDSTFHYHIWEELLGLLIMLGIILGIVLVLMILILAHSKLAAPDKYAAGKEGKKKMNHHHHHHLKS